MNKVKTETLKVVNLMDIPEEYWQNNDILADLQLGEYIGWTVDSHSLPYFEDIDHWLVLNCPELKDEEHFLLSKF